MTLHPIRIVLVEPSHPGNIGAVARHVYRESGEALPFVSGYVNEALPNVWDRSAAVRAALPARA